MRGENPSEYAAPSPQTQGMPRPRDTTVIAAIHAYGASRAALEALREDKFPIGGEHFHARTGHIWTIEGHPDDPDSVLAFSDDMKTHSIKMLDLLIRT